MKYLAVIFLWFLYERHLRFGLRGLNDNQKKNYWNRYLIKCRNIWVWVVKCFIARPIQYRLQTKPQKTSHVLIFWSQTSIARNWLNFFCVLQGNGFLLTHADCSHWRKCSSKYLAKAIMRIFITYIYLYWNAKKGLKELQWP